MVIMSTLVQSAPYPEAGSFKQQNLRHQTQAPLLSYTAAIPILSQNGTAINGFHPTAYRQYNVIPGLDSENAVVDTGVKLFGATGTHVQISTNTAAANDYDGKRMRRSIQRRTVDYNASTIQMMKHRLYRKSVLQKPVIQPDPLYYPEIVQPRCILHNPNYSVTTRFVRASTNKIRCPVFTVAWTPEGRRVVTGTSSGEFTLWNGLTFNFETILQAHESAVRAMEWSHNDMWLLSGDHNGVIKYWQSNMNNVKMIQAHTDPIRGLSFCPTDNKFVTCSDDGLLKVWDFYRCVEERALRGHGADVKCVAWHPSKSMVASGSKDSQQPLKLWDPKSGTSLATIHGHKSTVMDLDWNKNGNWLLTGSRDRLVKVFDIRVMKEINTFRGHKKEAASVNWHPLYEQMFASGGSDGSIMFWLLGCEKELGVMENAHDGMIWDIKWHPMGHILCSGSNDHTTKFWTRNRPGDKMRDKYNLNILPSGFDDDYEYELPTTAQSEDLTNNDSHILNGIASEGKIEKSDLESPIIKAVLEQSSLEVVKRTTNQTQAQIFTVSQLRPTAPVFKIDAKKQQKAIEEVEQLERRRERQLRRGDDKGNKRRRTSNHDDTAVTNAPSLLDLDIAPPAFLKDHDWDDDTKDPPFINDAKLRSNSDRPNNDRLNDGPPNNSFNRDKFDKPPPPNRFPENDRGRFDGPPPFKGPPQNMDNSGPNNNFNRPQDRPPFESRPPFEDRPPFDRRFDDRNGNGNQNFRPDEGRRNDPNMGPMDRRFENNQRPPVNGFEERFDKRQNFFQENRWEEERDGVRWRDGRRDEGRR